MKTLMLTTIAAAGLVFANAGTADAGQFQLVLGNGGYGYNGGFYGGGFNNGYYGGGYNGHVHHGVDPSLNPYPIGGHSDWHDTTHYDYVPGHWVRHGCHSHWVPGRYVLHQDGHFDLHH